MSITLSRFTLSRFPRRVLASWLAGMLVLGLLPATMATADPSFDDARVLAGDYLADRFQAGSYGAASIADTIYALAATGGHPEVVTSALDLLAETAEAYLGAPPAGNGAAIGKVMLAVQVAGGDPTNLGGRDLEAELRARIDDETGALIGGNAFGAALALAALARTADGVPEATADWYAGLRCTDPQSPNYGGFGWQAGGCGTIDIDTTALALQVLLATGHDDAAASTVELLLEVQDDATGGFAGAAGPGNANSTGLGGQALRAAGEVEAADAAATRIVDLQFGPEAEPSHVGGLRRVASDTASDVMATHQGVLALGAPALHELTVDQPAPPVAPVCDAPPHAPVLTVISRDEVLAFTVPGGGDIEVAVLGSVDDDLTHADFVIRDELALTDLDGLTRIVARLVHEDCSGDLPLFDATYDVRDTYPPGVGLGDTPAVHYDDERIVGWVHDWVSYEPGPNVAETWQVPENALGAVGAGNMSVVVLGDRGQITLTFDPPITDGVGDDLAVYENSFRISDAGADLAELGYVEVSSDGQTFVRFDAASRTQNPVGGFAGLLASDVGGLAGKDLAGYGTPFDLSALRNHTEVRDGTVDLDAITHVRVVDAVGDPNDPDYDAFGRPIWNPFPTVGSGGFDLAGVAALNVVDDTPAAPTWTEGWCQGDEGVSITVDFHALDVDRFDEPVVRCALGPHADGFSVLDGAGFETEGLFGGGYLCTVEGLPVDGTADGGAACLYEGYWAYWHADADDRSWTFSQLGAGSRIPEAGSAEAWSWTVIVDDDPDGHAPRVGPFGHEDTGGEPLAPLAPLAPGDLYLELVEAGRNAAGWLGRQLEANGGVLGNDPEYPDWGLTLDAVLALGAAGVGADVATDTMAAMRATSDGQLYPTFNAGAAAKTMLAVQAIGEDPTDYLDVDLEQIVRDRMDVGTGRFANQTVFGQSLAILALSTTEDGVPDLAIDWLVSAQCTDGDVAGAFHGSGCDRADGDHTGIALQALLASGSRDPDAHQAVDAAATWLESNQHDDGSFDVTFDGVTRTANSNSTGLVGQALRALGDADAADRAGSFVTDLQLGCAAHTTAESLSPTDVGAIAYARAGFDDAVAGGISEVARDEFWRATPQALLALGAPVLSTVTFEGAVAGLPEVPVCDDEGPGELPEPPELPDPQVPWNRGIDRVCDATPSTRFVDIGGSPHTRAIACLGGYGITQGSADPTRYAPRSTVTRGQLASFLDRLLTAAGSPLADAPTAFDDIGAPHAPAINRLAAAGIVEGFGGGGYAPNAPVSRDQIASMIARTLDVLDDGERNGSAPAPGTVDAFVDDRGSVHEEAINTLARAGVVQGYTDGRYGPRESVTRDQMASILLRSLDLSAAEGYANPLPLPSR